MGERIFRNIDGLIRIRRIFSGARGFVILGGVFTPPLSPLWSFLVMFLSNIPLPPTCPFRTTFTVSGDVVKGFGARKTVWESWEFVPKCKHCFLNKSVYKVSCQFQRVSRARLIEFHQI